MSTTTLPFTIYNNDIAQPPHGFGLSIPTKGNYLKRVGSANIDHLAKRRHPAKNVHSVTKHSHCTGATLFSWSLHAFAPVVTLLYMNYLLESRHPSTS